MAKDKGSMSVHSPASGLAEDWGAGGSGGQAPAPTVHPDINVSGSGGDTPSGATFGDTDMRTAVSVEEVQLATGIPENFSAGLGDNVAGALGTPPKA